MRPATFLKATALVYVVAALAAATIGPWFEGDVARHLVMGTLLGPWAEHLDLESTTGKWGLVAVLLFSWFWAAVLFVASHWVQRSGKGAVPFGSLVAAIGASTVAVEIQNLITQGSISGFTAFALAMMVGGARLVLANRPTGRDPLPPHGPA